MSYPQYSAQRKKRFLVTAATGFIGSRFGSLAMKKGHEVRTLSRSDWSDEPAVPVSQRYFGRFPNQTPSKVLQGATVKVANSKQP